MRTSDLSRGLCGLERTDGVESTKLGPRSGRLGMGSTIARVGSPRVVWLRSNPGVRPTLASPTVIGLFDVGRRTDLLASQPSRTLSNTKMKQKEKKDNNKANTTLSNAFSWMYPADATAHFTFGASTHAPRRPQGDCDQDRIGSGQPCMQLQHATTQGQSLPYQVDRSLQSDGVCAKWHALRTPR